jgi:spermidine synthase
LLAIVCWIHPAAPALAVGRFDTILADADTPYHHVSVVDTAIDGQDVRMMRFDRHVESTIAKSPPYPSVGALAYTDYFHLAFLAKAPINSALFIGAGGGVGPRAFHMHDPEMAIDVVDVDPKVLELARKWFFLDNCPQIRTFAADGRMFVRRAQVRYDCVILDAFGAGGRIPFHLVTREFLELCRDRMTADGVFLMNVDSAIDGPLAGIFHSMVRTLDTVFPNTYVFGMDHRSSDQQASLNVILVATRRRERIAPEQWAAAAAGHRSGSYVGSDRMQQLVDDLLVDLPDMAGAPLFSDDYAPIETMAF